MTQLKQNPKVATLLIFLVLGCLAVLFYWFQIRPSSIRSECSTKAKEYAHNLGKSYDDDNDGKISRDDSNQLLKLRDASYDSCLNTHGLSN